MKKSENVKYVKLGLTGVAVVAAGLLCFFLLDRFQEIANAIQGVLSILTPFLYGAVIAYLLAPACSWFERHLLGLLDRSGNGNGRKLSAALAILLTLLAAFLVLWLLLSMVLPQVCRSVIGIVNALPDQLESAGVWLHSLLKSQPDLQTYWDSFSAEAAKKLESWLQTDLLPTAQSLLTGLGSQVASIFAVVKNLFLGVIVSIYLLASRKKFGVQAGMVLRAIFPPKWAGRIDQEIRYTDRMFSGFLIGKLLDSAIIGLICFVCTSLMGFDSALLISVIVGVTNIIPFFGPFIGAIPCALLLLLENPMHCLYFIIFIILLQQIDGNIIGPKILGNSTGLSGFWVLFAILLFGGLWGFVGMIVGVPLFAVIYDIVRKLVNFGLARHSSEESGQALKKPNV